MEKETIALITAFKPEAISLLKDIKAEVSHIYDNGIANYVDTQRKKIFHTKTFLFGNDQVNFYDTFFQVSLTNSLITIENKENVFDIFHKSNCASIIGNAGSGKTMLLKHMFLMCIENKINIPIIIELRTFNDKNISFQDYVFEKILNNSLSPNKVILERILKNGRFFILLDGFDEIYTPTKHKLVEEIDAFIDRYPQNKFVLSSRPGTNIENMPRFEVFRVLSLKKHQIKHFIAQQVTLADNVLLGDKIIETIEKPENKDFLTYLGSPLLLSMFILTYNAYPELPKSKSKFYWNVYDTLCTKHDSITKKGGYLHERKSGLINEELELILKWLGYISLFECKYVFDAKYLSDKLIEIRTKLEMNYEVNNLIYDLTVSISLITQDGLEYRFPHKSLQEYFAAILIKEQSVESKEKIYSVKFTQLQNFTFGGHESFWNLCIENDNEYFYKFFILDKLNIIKDGLSNLSNKFEKAQYLYNLFGYFETVKTNNITREIELTHQFGYFMNLYEDIFPFIELPSFNEILSIRNDFNEEVIEKIEMLIENESLEPREDNFIENEEFEQYDIIYKDLNQSSLFELLEKTSIPDEVLKFEKLLNKTIDLIKRKLDDEQKKRISLLDI